MTTKSIAFCLFFAVCQNAVALDYLWKEGADYVALDSIEAADINHPLSIDDKKLARILSNLVFVIDKDEDAQNTYSEEDKRRVFTDRQIRQLTVQMTKALASSDPGKGVVFSSSDLVPSFLGNERLHVSGTLFFDGTKINLLFGEMHVDLQKKYTRSNGSLSNSRFASASELLKFRLDNGNLSNAPRHPWRLLEFNGGTLKNNRTDWIAIDLNSDYDFQSTESTGSDIEEQFLSERQKNIGLQGLQQRVVAIEEKQQKSEVKERSMLERLRLLKSLYQEGVLTEEVYEEKLRSIMNEL